MKKEDDFVWEGGAIVKEVWRCPECSDVGWPFFSIDIFLLEVIVGWHDVKKRMINVELQCDLCPHLYAWLDVY